MSSHSLIILLFLFSMANVSVAGPSISGKAVNNGPLTESERSFLLRHWPDSLPPKGLSPQETVPHGSILEASLHPQDCGSCHKLQFDDWSTSLHSRSMGPGVLGQLVDMVKTDPATTAMCWRCHTPLAEQQSLLPGESNGATTWKNNPVFDRKLQHQGLVCAGCHVRNNQRFGPPRKGTPEITGKIDKHLPHNGFIAETAFSKSEFCSGCHQFGPDDYRLNGKLIENTYNEWLASEYPEKGIQCQDCHMQDRRHLWRGIHDPEMVKKGVSISVEPVRTTSQAGASVEATITVANTGTGHYFPTYLTPKVFIRAYLLDNNGKVLETTVQEAIIGREVDLGLTEELYDTRIPPGDSLSVLYKEQLPQDGLSMKVEIVVEPDHFYERFYESVLEGNDKGPGRELLEQALEDTRDSAFDIYKQVFPLSEIAVVNEEPKHSSKDIKTENYVSRTIRNQQGFEKNAGGNAVHLDWNDKVIDWYDYEEGVALASETGKPLLFIIYAQWCPTCHAYKKIFAEPSIVAMSKKFIMVRADFDRRQDLSSKYNLDGEYVPRTFVLTPVGKVMQGLYPKAKRPRFFLSASDSGDLLSLMERALLAESHQLRGD